jgi:hypothetical protein
MKMVVYEAQGTRGILDGIGTERSRVHEKSFRQWSNNMT